MDPSSQFIVPTIIDVPELIVTNEDVDYEESSGLVGGVWFNKLQFISSALSYIINLGTVWRFPYLCHKYGGGAFLVAYTLVLIVVGLPLFLMELAFGQYANEGPITIWRISPAFEGIGYTMCLISAMVAVYYNMINTWLLHYLFGSLTFSELPWSSCDNRWNTAQCFFKPDRPTISAADCFAPKNSSSNLSATSGSTPSSASSDQSTLTFAASNSSILFITNCSAKVDSFEFERIINSTDDVILPANEYFHNNVLSISNSLDELGSFNWTTLIGLLLTWSIVFLVMLKDVRLTGRSALATMTMFYLALIALFARALSLPGGGLGVSHYLSPDWTKLQNIDIWADATTQVFFALSPCWGGIITLASMNKFHNNFHSDAMLIVSLNYLTSMFVGLVAFAILGHMSAYSGVAITEVVEVGLGFVLMVFTEALTKLPWANLNSIIFFTVLLLLGIASQLTVIETVITTIVDTWPHKLRYRKPLILMVLCSVMLILSFIMCFGNGFLIMTLMDTFSGTFTAMTVGILELIAIAWIYGMENFIQDIDDMISVHRNLFPSRTYWYFMWRYLTPSVLFAILLFSFTDLVSPNYRGYQFPEWTLKFGWTLTMACVFIIPALAFIRFLLSPSGTIAEKISYLCRPSEDWAPSSYVSGPKLINRHMMADRDFDDSRGIYTRQQTSQPYDYQDQESNESNEDLKVVNGRANYIIPEEEEEEDTDTGLITSETNV